MCPRWIPETVSGIHRPLHFFPGEPVPTTAHADRWYCLDGQAVAGPEARLLEAFVAAVPELRTYRLADTYRLLLAARRVLAARDLADAGLLQPQG